MNQWNVSKCAVSFNSVDDAMNYMCSHKYDGLILERDDGTFSAVCPEYPEGFYPDAKTVKEVTCSTEKEDVCQHI